MSQIVGRTFGIDFIYLDLILVSLWIILLLVRKRYKELLIGVFGYAVVLFTDAVMWYTLKKTRHIEIEGEVIGPYLFLAYFSFTYGVIMFSYAVMMFNRKVRPFEKVLWSVFLFLGWLAIALISQHINWNNTEIFIYRDMSNSRLKQILMAIIGYAVILAWKIISEFTEKFPFNLMRSVPYWYFGILILIGVFIHFSMEATLWIAHIRPSDWEVLVTNSLLEFNTGIPILFALWITINQQDYLVKKIPAKIENQPEQLATEMMPSQTRL